MAEEIEEIEERSFKRRSQLTTVIIIGIIAAGTGLFGFFEGSYFNTYLEHVLELEYIYISIMVSVSAAMGLIFSIIFGISSDNIRSKRFGRRRMYILIGGLVAGIAMILYGFSTIYFWCLLLDGIIIGIFSNLMYAANRPLVPDLIEIEHRGRANGIIMILGAIGTITPIGLSLVLNEYFSVNTGDGTIITQQGHQFAFFIGAFAIIFASIIGFLLLRDVPPSQLRPKRKFMEDLRDSFQYEKLVENKDFFKMILAMMIFNMGFRTIYPFLFNYVFSLGLSTVVMIIAISVLVPIILSVTILLGIASDKYGRKKFVPPVIILSSIGFLMIPFFRPVDMPSMIILIIAIILVFLAVVSLQVPLTTWQQDLLPEGKKGQFLGFLNIIQTASQIPGAIIGGLIADAYGIAWIFAVAPIFLLASLPIFLFIRETLPEKVIEVSDAL